MAKFEFKTQASMERIPPQTIEADHYVMDTKDGKLTFRDSDKNDIATYAIGSGAWCKRADK